MWYVSFHGSSGDTGINNIWRYSDKGNLKEENILPTGGNNPPLHELRAFQFRGNKLFVVNGNKHLSKLLVYKENKHRKFEFSGVYASALAINSIRHPYDFSFDDEDNCYLSSQDTNVVTGIGRDKRPLPVASYLERHYVVKNTFYQGTFVASSEAELADTPTPYPPNVPQPQGLDVSFVKKGSHKVANSVRGVLALGHYLYVADEVANCVKVYLLRTGEYCGQIYGKHLQAPVQLILDNAGKTLYIGSSGSDRIYCYQLLKGPPLKNAKAGVFIEKHISHVSGMAFDSKGNFYAAERKDKRIRKFDADGKHHSDFISNLPDNPEFIRYRH